jgi:hypothetical protein
MRSERPARNAEKAAGKKHTSPRDRDSGFTDSDEDVRDGTASREHHPEFDRRHPADREAAERI